GWNSQNRSCHFSKYVVIGCTGKCFNCHRLSQRFSAKSGSVPALIGAFSPCTSTRENTVCSTAKSSRSTATSCVGSSPARPLYSCACSRASVRDTSRTEQSGQSTRTQGSSNRLNSTSFIGFLLLPSQPVPTVIAQHRLGQMRGQTFIQQQHQFPFQHRRLLPLRQ